MATLPFNGTFLGRRDFGVAVTYAYPCRQKTCGRKPVTLYAILELPGYEPEYVILKRNASGKLDQIVCDELKPLFGLRKMGTHWIQLYGTLKKIDPERPWEAGNTEILPERSDYLVFRATTDVQDGVRCFLQLPTLKEAPDAADYKSVQKVLLFRELLHISDTNLLNILVLPDGTALSIDEMTIKPKGEMGRKLSKAVEAKYFPHASSRRQVLQDMLGANPDLEQLKRDMLDIIRHVDWGMAWVVDRVLRHCKSILSV